MGRGIKKQYDDEFDAVTWNDLNWLVRNGHKIGGHTDTHLQVGELNQKHLI